MASRYDRTAARRQKTRRKKKAEQGFKQFAGWAAPDTLRALRERYPGVSGGINWAAVLDAALKKS